MTVFRNQVTKTRPANTTAYAVNDVIADDTTSLWTFSGVARNKKGATGLVTNASLIIDSAESTALQAELFLFHSTVGLDADNATDTITDAEMKTCVGRVSFYTGITTTNQTIYDVRPNIQFTCGPDDQDLYGILLAKNAYTPVSGEVLDIIIEGIILR